MQTALHVHEKLCTVLIENTIENYLLAAHTDHYALRKEQPLPQTFWFSAQQSRIFTVIVQHLIPNFSHP